MEYVLKVCIIQAVRYIFLLNETVCNDINFYITREMYYYVGGVYVIMVLTFIYRRHVDWYLFSL
jgi:hypothetical protein